ncbi:MAG: endopeptidase La [Acidimicrobiia bacterium]|nr:endopeptidase La [Acidimicrobiia bacterium]
MAETTLPPTRTLPVLPLPNGVVLPLMVVTVAAESDEAKAAADAAACNDGELLLLPRIAGPGESGTDRFARVGVLARVESTGTLPGGTKALVIRATGRAWVGNGVIGATSGLWVSVEPIDDGEPTARAKELATELRATLRALFEAMGGRRLSEVLTGVDDPGALADLAGWWPELTLERRVELLEAVDVEVRVAKVLAWAREALAELELTKKIQGDVRDGMEKTQREFLLRQQLAAIRKELGDDGDADDELERFRARLEELRAAGVAEGVLTHIDREIGRLERTPAQNMEHGWIQTWLDTALGLPWTERTDDHLDVADARTVLDEDHTGLEEVKDRIVEFLAVRKLRAERAAEAEVAGDAADAVEQSARKGRGAVLALAGPPGVGKTSLGESVARALGRKFVRIALGGVRDEAELRGHRRTYVGAQAGRIVRAISEAGTMNPVVLLDEVDKLGSDYWGDPTSALLEVLDPAQNHTFRDHYLEVDLDLSDVLFLVTANVLEQIPGPLLDRLEIIRVDGYTEDEKVAIARDHLFARQVRGNGLRDGEVAVTEAALHAIVAGYTREAGVRELERQLGKSLRKVAVRIAGGEAAPITIDEADVAGLLGRARFQAEEVAERTSVPGVATGLAVTGAGGDVLFVETTAVDGEPGLIVTGQLGDVMKESAQIALSLVRSRADAVGLDPATLARRFHVHFPAGAVPKDGPSAGVTMTTALVSLLTGRRVRGEVGMTGEVTLSGKVLPIGGVKQKVLAAHRAGLTEVILPKRNEPDLDDIPDAVREAMVIHLVDDVAEVLDIALAA